MKKNELLEKAEKELYDEAKRITSLLYDDNFLCLFDMDKYYDILNPLYKFFSTDIKLRVMKLCDIKYNGDDYQNYMPDILSSVDHHTKYVNYKIEQSNINLNKIVKEIAKDISENIKKYKGKSIFVIIPKLSKKYIHGHYDSVDYIAIIMLLNSALKENNIYLNDTII